MRTLQGDWALCQALERTNAVASRYRSLLHGRVVQPIIHAIETSSKNLKSPCVHAQILFLLISYILFDESLINNKMHDLTEASNTCVWRDDIIAGC